MKILGLSAFYHDSAACLLADGALLSAVQEERLSRIKHDRRFPILAAAHCLASAGLTILDIDCVAWYELPERRLSRQLWLRRGAGPRRDANLTSLDPYRPERVIREALGFEGPIFYACLLYTSDAADE